MTGLKVGQVLSMIIRIPYCGVFKERHPYLILSIADGAIEIGQLHSLEGKEFEAINDQNKVIYNDLPSETVIDKDSFIQLNNKILLEDYPGLLRFRRQEDVLSAGKMDDVAEAYIGYHKKHHIAENRIVYLDKEEIESLNPE